MYLTLYLLSCQYCGPEGDRTPYLRHAMAALYQVSYRPRSFILYKIARESSDNDKPPPSGRRFAHLLGVCWSVCREGVCGGGRSVAGLVGRGDYILVGRRGRQAGQGE